MTSPDATPGTDQHAYQFPDGSEIELTVRTEESAILRIFTADVTRRMRRFQLAGGEHDTSLAAFRSYAPGNSRDDHASTTTHSLPDGEVTVSIDATGRGSHGYLYHLVTAAVAYTHAVDLDVGKVGTITAVLLGAGLAIASLGGGFLSLPFLGAGGTIGLHLLVYLLSAHGVTMSLSRVPTPTGPYA